MTTYTSQTPIFGDTHRPSTTLSQFSAEVKAFVSAIFSPNQIIGEVEQMMALRRQAAQLEANDPDQAAALRKEASQIGL